MGNSQGKPVSFDDQGSWKLLRVWREEEEEVRLGNADRQMRPFLLLLFLLASYLPVILSYSELSQIFGMKGRHPDNPLFLLCAFSEPESFPSSSCGRKGCFRQGSYCWAERHRVNVRIKIHSKRGRLVLWVVWVIPRAGDVSMLSGGLYQRMRFDWLTHLSDISSWLVVRSESVRNIIRERRMLENLDHPFLCNLRYSFQDLEYMFVVSAPFILRRPFVPVLMRLFVEVISWSILWLAVIFGFIFRENALLRKQYDFG